MLFYEALVAVTKKEIKAYFKAHPELDPDIEHDAMVQDLAHEKWVKAGRKTDARKTKAYIKSV